MIEEKVVLDFEDMKLAWGVLAVGLGISTVILVGKVIRQQLGFFWKRFLAKHCQRAMVKSKQTVHPAHS